jgi:hypothetical protein
MRDEHDDECSFYRFCVYDDLLAVVVLAAVAVAAVAVVVAIPFYILHKEINYF